jgi:hypothetical protein
MAALCNHPPRPASNLPVNSPASNDSTRINGEGMYVSNVHLVHCRAVLVAATGVSADHGRRREATLAVVMTNDAAANQIKVYDAATQALLQTLSTHGKGGVGGNARGVRQYNGELFAAVNNGSNSVALFRREGNGLRYDGTVSTTSAPVSVDFGNGHMYIAGATTVDSFVLRRDHVGWRDGTTVLQFAGGGTPPPGSTAQVGVLDSARLLVTLKADPEPGTVDIVPLHDGEISGANPTAVSAPPNTMTPFGFSVLSDGTAAITLAHSHQDGLFRDGAFKTQITAGQLAPCWMTRAGKYLFTANTGSGTVSRLVSTGNHIFVDGLVAATIASGGGAPSDIDSENGVLGVIDRGAGQSRLSLFRYNEFGELTAFGAPIVIGVPSANGVAIIPPPDSDGD